ncbi:MAG: tetratricopeptide repeat protein [Gemmobacter sp.]
MRTDAYGNALSTMSDTAAAAYRDGCDRVLRAWPGAVDAFDSALLADQGFALAHVGRARVLQLAGDMAGARAAIAAAKASPVADREASHIEVFHRMANVSPAAALDQVRRHMQDWPRDAFVATTAANQTGLIGTSGRVGREEEQVEFLERLAPHYGPDWWLDGHYGMALSELGHHAAAQPILDRSLAACAENAFVAHAMAHLLYETDAAETATHFLGGWLSHYPREGGLYGHLSWHLALVHLAEGRIEEGFRLFDDAFAAEPYSGPPIVKMLDAPSFLWRAELAGYPRDVARWQKVGTFAHRTFPSPGIAFADWHMALAEAATGADVEPRAREIETLAEAGRYSAGLTVPRAARGFGAFERGDYATAIAEFQAMIDERARMSGSRAQLDLVEFTLLKAYLAAGRHAEARQLLAARRSGPQTIPVAGIEVIT